MAQLQPDYNAPRILPYQSLLGKFFAPSAPTIESGAPQGATQPNLAAPGTGQLPASGGTLDVDGSDNPVIPPIANPYADPQYREMQEQMYGKIQDSIAAQKLSEQDAAKLLKDYLGQDQAMDLSPLLAWVDSSYGTNLQRGYTKPMTREERMLKAADLQDILRKAGAGVTEKELELLRAKMGDKKSEAEILANMQYRRELLAAQKAKEANKSDPSNLTPAQISGIKSKYLENEGKTIRGLARMKQAANVVNEKLTKIGSMDVYDAEISKGFADLLVNYNTQIAQLGALTGPDLQLLQAAITMPSGLAENFLMNAFGKRTTADIKKTMGTIMEKANFNVTSLGEYTDTITRPLYDKLVNEYHGYSKIGTEQTSDSDPRIDSFMKKNNLTDRNEAIKILKEKGLL